MKRLSNLARSLRQLLVGILAVMPLLMVTTTASAADHDVDFSQAELDQMLAPIALYPDTLLSQVLIASTYPLEIIQADRWVRSNKDLKTEDALKFAENKDWDPSVKALVAFPDLLKRMSDDTDWTQRLGDAFLDDEQAVMDSVQRLRKRAYATGNLEKAQHIRVEEEDANIVIEPAEERVVYVPVYDTRVVYGNWWWSDYPPTYWSYPSHYTYVSGFYWGPSIFIGSTYFYSSCHWRDRRVVVVDRHHYHSAPGFYTGRSIVRYEGARAWRHDPVHRHGVAYYSERQRTDFGSRRTSYQNDRVYRDQFRNNQGRDHDRYDHSGNDNRWKNNDRQHDNRREFDRQNDSRNSPRIVRDHKRDTLSAPDTNTNTNINTTVNTAGNSQPVNRAEQLRERMNRTNDGSGRHWSGNPEPIRNAQPVQLGTAADINGVNSPRQEQPRVQPERSDANLEARNRAMQRFDNPGDVSRPTITVPPAERAAENDRAQPRFERREESRRVDLSPPRAETRAERTESHNSGGHERVIRGQRRDNTNN